MIATENRSTHVRATFFSAHAVKMVSSDVRITGAVARQTGLRAVQIETNGLASVGFC